MKINVIIFVLVTSSPILAAKRTPFCIAHRGNSSVELENSRSSILSAADMGVGAVEFDIQHTKDGVAIINHDKNLKRVTKKNTDNSQCNRSAPLAKLRYDQIENCTLKNGESVPLFKDILRELKPYSIKLIIEYKSAPSPTEMKWLSDLYSDQPERIIFISFKEKYLDQIISWRRIFPFLKKVKVLRLKQKAYSRNDRFDGLNTQFLSRRNVKCAHEKGRLIGTFTKNSVKKIKKYLKKGVDFITTNYPQRCMDVLQER